MQIKKLLILGIIISSLCALLSLKSCNSESYLRHKVVTLTSNKGECSGIEIHSPKGDEYILTAAHCSILVDEHSSILASVDDQRPIPRKIIEVSPVTDLMLLEGLPQQHGISVASSIALHDHIFKLGRGFGLATHRADGEFIDVKHADISAFEIHSPEDEVKCNLPKYKIVKDSFGEIFGITSKICNLSIDFGISTMEVNPGDSGSGVFNNNGNIIGIVSASSDRISLFVQLSDIQNFMEPY